MYKIVHGLVYFPSNIFVNRIGRTPNTTRPFLYSCPYAHTNYYQPGMVTAEEGGKGTGQSRKSRGKSKDKEKLRVRRKSGTPEKSRATQKLKRPRARENLREKDKTRVTRKSGTPEKSKKLKATEKLGKPRAKENLKLRGKLRGKGGQRKRQNTRDRRGLSEESHDSEVLFEWFQWLCSKATQNAKCTHAVSSHMIMM